MHWGHAVSRDLVHWDNLPIALFPDRHGTIFSGSAVVDAGNTAGFGANGASPLVAMFTYHDHLAEKLGRTDFQSQGLAYSLDRGRNWTKYALNPVIPNPGSRDFRDPKVFWYAPTHAWIVTLAVHDHVAFYSSPDLKTWTHESDFGQEFGAHTGVWECPDLIEAMPGSVAGAGREPRAVLLVSINPGGPNGGSATQYFVGRFDGHRFTVERPHAAGEAAALWVDYGTDDYAGSTWSGAKPGDARQLFLGWMSNWQYGAQVPTQPWRSAMTLPRELRLVDGPNGPELRSLPVAELAALRQAQTLVAAAKKVRDVELAPHAAGAAAGLRELELRLRTRDANLVELTFGNAGGERTVFRINKAEHCYEVDRSASGAVDFNAVFKNLQTAPLAGTAASVLVHAYVDRSSVELFIDDGAAVFTTSVFPSAPYDKITLSADRDIAIDSGVVYELASIWRTH
jgi:fructan beta-fructosidase